MLACPVSALLVVLAAGDAAPPPAKDKVEAPKPRGTGVAVLPLAVNRISDEVVGPLSLVLVNAVDRYSTFDVISMKDIEALLGLEGSRQALGCDEVSCFAEIGGALGAPYLMTGDLARIGNEAIASVSLIATQRATVVSRHQVRIEAREELYADALVQAVKGLFAREQLAFARAAGVEDEPVNVLAWLALAGSVAAGGAGAVLLGLSTGDQGDIREGPFATFAEARTVSEAESRYGDVAAAVSEHNTRVIAGYSLLGVAGVGLGLTLWAFIAGGEEPTATVTASPGGAALLWSGRW